MKIVQIAAAAGLALVLLSGAAFAQAAAPAPAAPAAAPPAAAASPMAPSSDKKAKAKECSLAADKQGLHGKARKAFRSKCKAGKVA